MVSRLFTLLLLIGLALAAGCTRTTLQASAADEYGASDEMTRMDFWDSVSLSRAVSNADAVHALALHYGLEVPGDQAGRLKLVQSRGWSRSGADLKANETARAGFVARAVCMEQGIKGGVTMRLVGARERYALSELNYRGWLPGMSPEQAVSGLQLIALLSKAEDAASERPDVPREKFE